MIKNKFRSSQIFTLIDMYHWANNTQDSLNHKLKLNSWFEFINTIINIYFKYF